MHVHVHAGAGLDGLDRDQAGHQADDGEAVEQEHGLEQRGADLAVRMHAGHAHHDGAEDDRHDHHLHELDEAIAQGLRHGRDLRVEVPERDAGGDADQHLDIKLLVEALRLSPARGCGSAWAGMNFPPLVFFCLFCEGAAPSGGGAGALILVDARENRPFEQPPRRLRTEMRGVSPGACSMRRSRRPAGWRMDSDAGDCAPIASAATVPGVAAAMAMPMPPFTAKALWQLCGMK